MDYNNGFSISSFFLLTIFSLAHQGLTSCHQRMPRDKEDEICKLIKAFPKDIAALDKRSVLAKVNSQGSGT